MTTAIEKRQNAGSPASFGNVFDNIFQNSLHRFFDDNFWDSNTMLATASVPVNVREKDLQYEMDVIAPGCRKEGFTIQVDNKNLTISFNHNDESNERDEKTGWVRNEYIKKSFTRTFILNETIDVTKITANYVDGILRLVLPKSEKAQRVVKNIEIK